MEEKDEIIILPDTASRPWCATTASLERLVLGMRENVTSFSSLLLLVVVLVVALCKEMGLFHA